jgi:hypothetical protein
VDKLTLELDCSGAVTKLVSKEVDRSVQGHLVEDNESRLKKGFGNFVLNHVLHSGNAVAHRFAKDGYHNKLCKSKIFVPLGYLMNTLASDCADD